MGSSGPMGLFAHNSAASGPREGGQKGRLLLFFPSFFCHDGLGVLYCAVLHTMYSAALPTLWDKM